ncbi:hypothetical protein PF003_g40860 [Phytophthora fragariae]|nr:hypothetical protein PF003_g40860 [Phytophthora fragariae]
MTTETRIIVRPAPDALRAVGPIKTHANVPTPSDMEEKPPTPASNKHSGDPEVAKAASASKKPANDMEEAKETQALEKHAKDAGEAKKLPASKKPKVAATKAKKVTASSKPAPKKPVVKKPAAKQLPKTKGASKEGQKTLKLPPKRSAVLLPGPHEDMSSDSSDTDTPGMSVAPARLLLELGRPRRTMRLPRMTRPLPLRGVVRRRIHPWRWTTRSRSPTWTTRTARSSCRRSGSLMPSGTSIREAPCLPRLWWRWNAPDSWRSPCLVETTRPLRCRSPRSSPMPVSTRESLLSCFSPRIGNTWPIVLIRRPLRRWAPSGIARPTPLAPKSSYSRCDTGLGTRTMSTFARVACLAQARRSATSVRSCSWRTPVSPDNGMRPSSRGS